MVKKTKNVQIYLPTSKRYLVLDNDGKKNILSVETRNEIVECISSLEQERNKYRELYIYTRDLLQNAEERIKLNEDYIDGEYFSRR